MKLIGIALLLTSLLLACALAPEREIVAWVGGDRIRVGDLQAALKEEAFNYDPELLTDPEAQRSIKQKTLNGLIEEQLLLDEAHRQHVTLTAPEVREEIERLKSGYDGMEFQEKLKSRGLSPAEWERRQQNKLLIGKLVSRILEPHRPSAKEIEEEFRKNRDRYREPERSHCRQIVTSSREKATMILSLLKKDENFAVIARQYSESPDRNQGGDLGWVARGELPPIMDEACFRFKSGQTSPVVSSSYGFHIFRVIEKNRR